MKSKLISGTVNLKIKFPNTKDASFYCPCGGILPYILIYFSDIVEDIMKISAFNN